MITSESTTFSSGSFEAGTAQVAGTGSTVTLMGVGTGTTAMVDDSDLVEQVTTFSPAGPGRVSWVTESLYASGDLGITHGTVGLLGNPDGTLETEVTVVLTGDLEEEDDDNSDGLLTGTYSGQVTQVFP